MSNIAQIFFQNPIIPCFLIANLAIGLWAYMRSKSGSFEDYALASRSLPTGVLAMTILATIVSSNELAKVDITFEDGILQSILAFFQFLIPIVFITQWVTPRLVFFKGSTLGSCMGEMYGGWTQVITAIIQIVFSMGILSAQLAVMGILANEFLGLDEKTFVMFFGVTIVVYSALGGMRSVSYTDVLQLIAVLGVFFFVTQKAMLKVGGVGSLMHEISTNYQAKLVLFDHPKLWLKIRGKLYTMLPFSYLLAPPIMHRMLILKESKKLNKAWYTTFFVYTVILVITGIIGFFGIVHRQSLGITKGSNLFIHIVQYLFVDQPWMMHAMMVGMISMLMSTIDSYLHTLGIICVEDILGPMQKLFNRKRLTENRQVMYARISVLVIGVLALAISLQMDESGPSFVGRKLVGPLKAIQAVVIIPFILGAMGLKPDKTAFISFAITYLGSFSCQKWLLSWQSHLGYRARHVYFLVALLLGIIAYLVAHVYKHKGIAIVYRNEDSTSHKVWVPSWTRMRQGISTWLRGTFNLMRLAHVETSNRPIQSLVFSMVMFVVYASYSLLYGGSGGEGLPEFMAVMYMVGMVLCCGLMLEGMWPRSLQHYFPLYWLTTLWYCLPFGGTIVFLRMHDSVASMFFFVGSFVLLAALVRSRTFFWMSMWGVALAHASWYVLHRSMPTGLGTSGTYVGACFVLGILVVALLVFGREVEQHITNRLYINRALAGAVTHEAMEPLQWTGLASTVAFSINQTLTSTQHEGEKGFFLSKGGKKGLVEVSDLIDDALAEIRKEFYRYGQLLKKNIYLEKQEKISMSKLIDEVLPDIAKRYQSNFDVKVTCKQDFEAYVLKELFDTVLRNLIKNAKKHGRATQVEVTIDGEGRKVYFRDNGTGIPPEVFTRIFDFGFTTKSSSSHGVGLPLVRTILDASGVKIICRSHHGDEDSFTEFVMVFPEA